MTSNTSNFITSYLYPKTNAEIRVATKADDSIWFIAQDLSRILGLKQSDILKNVGAKEKTFFEETHTQLAAISETAAIKLIKTCQQDGADELLEWIEGWVTAWSKEEIFDRPIVLIDDSSQDKVKPGIEQNTYATVTTYNFDPHAKVRVIKRQNGDVWFSIEDVCKATGIIQADAIRDIDEIHMAVFIAYNSHEKSEIEIDMISFLQLEVIVAVSNMVRARAFLQWVETEIMGIENDQEDMIELTEPIDYEDQPVDMRTFNFKNSTDHEIRTIIMDDGSIWFVAKDVCDVLELINSRKAISTLDEDEKASVTISDTSLSSRKTITVKAISESGLYALVFKSRKPEAKKFRKWVTSEVLPQIRQTGAYMPEQPTAPEQQGTPERPVRAQDIPHIDPTTVSGLTIPAPDISHNAATAFVQAATDTFWGIEKALNEYKAMEQNLKKAKKDVAVIIRSAKKVFPDIAESINMLGGNTVELESKLEIEMR